MSCIINILNVLTAKIDFLFISDRNNKRLRIKWEMGHSIV